MQALSGKLFLSGMDENAASLARKWGLGLELTDFCEARKLEEPAAMEAARARCSGIGSLWLHAPFAELIALRHRPARARQVVDGCASGRPCSAGRCALGIRRIVVHSGYIPLRLFPGVVHRARSVEFWREFLRAPRTACCLALENVMEPGPDMLVRDRCAAVNDPRFGLCLDVGHANTRRERDAACWTGSRRWPPWSAPCAPAQQRRRTGTCIEAARRRDNRSLMPDILAALAELSPAADYHDQKIRTCEPSLRWLCKRTAGYLRKANP